MIVLEKRPVTLAEARSFIPDSEEVNPMNDYFKKFTKLNENKAEELLVELRKLNNLKLKEESMIKITDFLPENSEEVNKIVNEVSLNEEEINAVLAVVKNYI